VFQFSITIAMRTEDIDVNHYLPKLERFLERRCLRGMFATERGGKLQHLHIQGVIELKLQTGREVRKLLILAMGWETAATKPPLGMIMVKVLSQQGLHTFLGLVGYCVKDERRDHFQIVAKNITEADFNKGRSEYVLYGKVDESDRVELNVKSLMPRMVQYFRYCYKKQIAGTIDILDVLTDMIKSGKYYFSPAWCVGNQARGIDMRRFRALWLTAVMPQNTTPEDVQQILFPASIDERERYHASGTQSSRFIQYDEVCEFAAQANFIDLRTVNTTDTLADDDDGEDVGESDEEGEEEGDNNGEETETSSLGGFVVRDSDDDADEESEP